MNELHIQAWDEWIYTNLSERSQAQNTLYYTGMEIYWQSSLM